MGGQIKDYQEPDLDTWLASVKELKKAADINKVLVKVGKGKEGMSASLYRDKPAKIKQLLEHFENEG